jgi:hypothetical protein
VLLEIDPPLGHPFLQSLQTGQGFIGHRFPQQRHHRLRRGELRGVGRQVQEPYPRRYLEVFGPVPARVVQKEEEDLLPSGFTSRWNSRRARLMSSRFTVGRIRKGLFPLAGCTKR